MIEYFSMTLFGKSEFRPLTSSYRLASPHGWVVGCSLVFPISEDSNRHSVSFGGETKMTINLRFAVQHIKFRESKNLPRAICIRPWLPFVIYGLASISNTLSLPARSLSLSKVPVKLTVLRSLCCFRFVLAYVDFRRALMSVRSES